MNRILHVSLTPLFGLATLLGTLILTGCATVSMAPMEQDAAAKAFVSPSDLSRIYLYRNDTFGGALPITVSLDGKTMGRTGPQTYFMWDVSPGEHTIISRAADVDSLTLNTVRGRAHYVWQEVEPGLWSVRSQLQEVDETTGQSNIRECKLAQSAQ